MQPRARTSMTMTAVALLVCCALPVARAADAPGPAPGVPHLEVPERIHAAGKIERGTTLRHSFVLKNTGTANLSIDAKPG